MADFNKFIHPLLKREAGFVNDKDDSGGATRWGITEAVARANGYKGKMEDLPQSFAIQVYKKKYWDSLSLDQVKNQSVADFIADVGVNMGVWRAAIMTQDILNLYFEQKLVRDGKFGTKSVAALNNVSQAELFLRWQKVRASYYKYISNQPFRDRSQDIYFETLHPKYPEQRLGRYDKNKKFYNGWLAHRVVGLRYVA